MGGPGGEDAGRAVRGRRDRRTRSARRANRRRHAPHHPQRRRASGRLHHAEPRSGEALGACLRHGAPDLRRGARRVRGRRGVPRGRALGGLPPTAATRAALEPGLSTVGTPVANLRRVTFPPRATYRLQLHAGFTFDDARAIVPYLARLGISHLYCSPVLQAMPGSTHGYDVVDHGRVSTELGGEAGFGRLTDAVREHGMGLVLDIVPNHMAIGEQNRWWWDVLKHGRGSRYAARFDIDWEPPDPRLRNAVLLPVLAEDYTRVVEAGQIRLMRKGNELVAAHGDRFLPLDPQTLDGLDIEDDGAIAAINEDSERLDALLASQHWRLAPWRAASTDLNYRRFFDVDALIGLRMEEPDVFRDTHSQVLEWVGSGRVDGLRIDHPDGLRDPAAYFEELRAVAPGAWIVAEKILEPDEALRSDWPVEGTTGYRFANLATGLQVDAGGEAGLSDAWAQVADAGPEWEPLVAAARREVLASALGSDLNRLTKLFLEVCQANPRYGSFSGGELRDALLEVAAALGAYRTYVRPGDAVTAVDAGLLAEALGRIAGRRPDLGGELFDLLGRILRLEV